jgi:hypothetical protein
MFSHGSFSVQVPNLLPANRSKEIEIVSPGGVV